MVCEVRSKPIMEYMPKERLAVQKLNRVTELSKKVREKGVKVVLCVEWLEK